MNFSSQFFNFFRFLFISAVPFNFDLKNAKTFITHLDISCFHSFLYAKLKFNENSPEQYRIFFLNNKNRLEEKIKKTRYWLILNEKVKIFNDLIKVLKEYKRNKNSFKTLVFF